MEREDLLLLAAFTRTDAGFDPEEAAPMRALVQRGWLTMFSESRRLYFNITPEGHARVTVVVSEILKDAA